MVMWLEEFRQMLLLRGAGGHLHGCTGVGVDYSLPIVQLEVSSQSPQPPAAGFLHSCVVCNIMVHCNAALH